MLFCFNYAKNYASTMGQCLVRVRGSNNVLHVVQTNQTFLIKLGNKRIVLRCLTEIKLRKTSSIIVIHASQTSETCFTRLDGSLGQ